MKKNKTVLEIAKDLQKKTGQTLERAFLLSYLENSQKVKNYAVVDKLNPKIPKNSTLIFESDKFKIFYKETPEYKDFVKTEKLTKRLAAVYDRFCKFNARPKNFIPTITVGILTYNQEDYILECLESVIKQTGDFKLKVIILDDNSTDNTGKIIKDYLKTIKNPLRDQITYIKNQKNIGVTENFQKLIKLVQKSDCDYFTFCEGDDYYLTCNRLQKHLSIHNRHPEIIFSFNKLLLYYQKENRYELDQPNFNQSFLTTEELARYNHPGSLCASFYSSTALSSFKINPSTKLFIADWIFNIIISQFGDVYQLNLPMSLYRKHSEGAWSGNDNANALLATFTEEYNIATDYLYDEKFKMAQADFIDYLFNKKRPIKHYDLTIIDNIFPHPLSNFSYQEFTNLLNKIPDSSIFITGAFSKLLSVEPFENIVANFKRTHPKLASKVFPLVHNSVINTTLLYGIFLNTAYYTLLPLATKNQIPFVFTLYPGGAFFLNDKRSDQMLKEIFESPFFRKVIVTQKVTYDYLIKKRLCPKEKIEFIFGVVTDPKKALVDSNSKKFDIDKKTLDICFVAHKYSEKGEDKGYDLFIDVAKKLSKKYNNINFHVVGPWKDVLDTSDIKNITFYGSVLPDFFEGFFADKDIIVSANRPNILTNGAFDGFPTTSVTDASFNGVAMFCTDPLKLNQNRFIDKEEIVIIKPSANDIYEKIEYYYNHPKELQKIAKNGQTKTRRLYSDAAQITPRLKLLVEEIEKAKKNPTAITPPSSSSLKPVAKKYLKKVTPKIARRAFRKAQRIKSLIKEA